MTVRYDTPKQAAVAYISVRFVSLKILYAELNIGKIFKFFTEILLNWNLSLTRLEIYG